MTWETQVTALQGELIIVLFIYLFLSLLIYVLSFKFESFVINLLLEI